MKTLLLTIVSLISLNVFAADRITLSPGATAKLEANKITMVTCEAEGGLPICSIAVDSDGYYFVKMSNGFSDDRNYSPNIKTVIGYMSEFRSAKLCK